MNIKLFAFFDPLSHLQQNFRLFNVHITPKGITANSQGNTADYKFAALVLRDGIYAFKLFAQ